MKCTIPEISWHNRDPVLSVDIQPIKVNETHFRLASGGTDSHVLIWLLTVDNGGIAELECAADLTRHTKPVNCVRFSPSGEFLATGDDEACIIIWKLKTGSDPLEFPIGEEENFKEQWISVKVLRGHLQDVYDLSWSADSKHLISGSVDNTAIMWDVSTGKNLAILSDHKGFVQGVTWDPCGQYVATLSSDRICRVYSVAAKRVICRLRKGLLPGAAPEAKPTHYFHDDTLKSFFRRLCFSPDGELLIAPSALVEAEGKTPANATIVFSRHRLNKPLMYLPSLTQYSVAVRCCPVLFTLRASTDPDSPPLLPLPYRVVIAVATQCSVVLYDTQHAAPFAFITKIHYTRLTDLTWSNDGRVLVVSSTDGYCSVITFAENELGTVYVAEKAEEETGEKNTMKTENLEPKDAAADLSKATKELKSDKVIIPPSEDANMPMDISSDESIQLVSATSEDIKSENPSQQPSESEKAVKRPSEESAMEFDDFQLVYETTVTEPFLETKSGQEKSTISANSSISTAQNQESRMDFDNVPKAEVKLNNSEEPSSALGTSQQKEESPKPVEGEKVKPKGDTVDSSKKEVESPCGAERTRAPECAKDVKSEGLGEKEVNKSEKGEEPKAAESVSPAKPVDQQAGRPETTSPQPNRSATTPGNSGKKTPRRVKLITLSSPKSKKKLL